MVCLGFMYALNSCMKVMHGIPAARNGCTYSAETIEFIIITWCYILIIFLISFVIKAENGGALLVVNTATEFCRNSSAKCPSLMIIVMMFAVLLNFWHMFNASIGAPVSDAS